MAGSRAMRYVQRYASSPATARPARRFAAAAALIGPTPYGSAQWTLPSAEARESADLVTAELVNNAIEHGQGTYYSLIVTISDELFRVEVEDQGHYPPDRPLPSFDGPAELDAESGRGLMLVAGLCTDYGIRRSENTAGLIAWGTVKW